MMAFSQGYTKLYCVRQQHPGIYDGIPEYVFSTCGADLEALLLGNVNLHLSEGGIYVCLTHGRSTQSGIALFAMLRKLPRTKPLKA